MALAGRAPEEGTLCAAPALRQPSYSRTRRITSGSASTVPSRSTTGRTWMHCEVTQRLVRHVSSVNCLER